MKASWWEYYRLRDLPPEDQADEPMVIVGLEFIERVDVKLQQENRESPRALSPTATATRPIRKWRSTRTMA